MWGCDGGLQRCFSTSKQYSYYCCSNQKKGKCKKKSIRKDLIGPLVVEQVVKVLNNKYLDTVAKSIAEYSRKDGNDEIVKHLEKKLKENRTALENLVIALEQGKSVDIITAQIEKRQAEGEALQVELARERVKSPELDERDIFLFFSRFKNGDTKDTAYCASLIDLFVRKIFLFEDKNGDYFEITCNASDKSMKIPIDEPKGSPKGDLVRLLLYEPPAIPVVPTVTGSQ